MPKIVKELFELWQFRYAIAMTVLTNLKVRYRRSYLGFFWSMLGPALSYGVLAVVFFYGAKVSKPNYFAHLLPGIVLFTFFSAGTSNGTMALINSEIFIKKIYAPKVMFVLNVVLSDFVNFCLTVITVLGAATLFGVLTLSLSWLAALPVLIMALLFVIGIATSLAVLTVFFRDIYNIVPLIMQAAFYATPIFYSVEDMPENIQLYLRLNPFFYFVEAFRAPLTNHTVADANTLLVCFLLTTLSLVIGRLLIKVLGKKIIFRL